MDFSLIPRECGCEYCCTRGAAYVSKSGTPVEVSIRRHSLHRISEHGSGQACFHECGNCGDLVLVTAEIDGELYAALNVHCLAPGHPFPEARAIDFSVQSAAQKLNRWRQNWCYPVSMQGQD